MMDTSVVSMRAPGKLAIPGELADWFDAHVDALFICAVTVTEIEQGICKLRRTGAEARANRLAEWLETMTTSRPDLIWPLDIAVCRLAGQVSDHATALGRHPGLADILIAATAMAHDATLLTRNVRHFEPLGVKVGDPLARLPD
ncbi:MAG: twitching motility protein PilT [Caulobacter sp.]|nr:twitching motility protein PilT [Caulobacter sp.]